MKKQQSSRNGLTFLLTFLVALMLFGGLTAWVLIDVWDPAAAPSPTAPTTATTQPTTVRKDLRMLLITEDGGEAQGFVAISVEPQMGRVRVVPVPRETAVTAGTEQTRLFERYRSTDLATLTAEVGTLLQWDISHYAVISYHALTQFVTYLNEGVIYTLTENISYQNAVGTTVNMAAGARTLSATQVPDVLRYDAWHGGRRARANAQGDIVAALFNQYFTAGRLDGKDADFKTFITLTRSNIMTSDYVNAADTLLAVARRNSFDISTVTPPKGEFIGVGDAMRFEIAEKPLN